jgi:myo-inositol 2-dehydrogenase/D-chiro-inositol 1-dehydrogenase
MRLALLGIDDQLLALAAAAMRSERDRIVIIDALAHRAAEAAAISPRAQLTDDWNTMLDSQIVDAVLVASDQPAKRIDQLRPLIQTRMPVLVSHPVSLSMLDCFELEMIREETKCVVLAYTPGRWHPASAELGTILDGGQSSPIAAVEQITFERFLQCRERDGVLGQFARDADLIQFIAGPATKLHAMGSAPADRPNRYANVAVQMTCSDGLVCRWTVAPVETAAGGKLTLVGSQGKVILWMPDGKDPWRLELRTIAGSSAQEYPQWNAAEAALEMLSLAVANNEIDSNWNDAARTVELADAIDRSMAKGRTIDLHHEEFSDVGTFKGTMASAGCGLLVVGLILVVVVALIHTLAAQAGWNRLARMLDGWPYLVLVVFGIFLLLQLLVFVGKGADRNNAGLDESNDSRNR